MLDTPTFEQSACAAYGLQQQEMAALRSASVFVGPVARHGMIIPDGGRSRLVALVRHGWAGRVEEDEGRRQIFDFLLPGDICGLEEMTLGSGQSHVRALTDVIAEYFDVEAVESLLASHPVLAAAFLRHAVAQAMAARVGQSRFRLRSATKRLAGLIHDLVLRMNGREETRHGEATIPLTQYDLADATGLTAIHVNRVLRKFRAEGIISMGSRRLSVTNWTALCAKLRISDHVLLAD